MASTPPSGSKRKKESKRAPSSALLSIKEKLKAVIPSIKVYFAKVT